ncbi:MAG: lysophospholipid acyltransferase family protein [Acidobacteriota bacterium]
MSAAAHRLWRALCALVVRVFYRRFEVDGREHLPAEGPVLLCANHVNALVDAVVVQAACDRPVHPLARSGLFRSPVLRPFLALQGAVPVARRHPGRDAASVRTANAAAFEKVHARLAAGGVLLIFPEGQSHSDPHLRPIKTGAARLVLGAHQRGIDPPIVPVGLTFPRKGTFRGSVLVRFGPPIESARFAPIAPAPASAAGDDGPAVPAPADASAARQVKRLTRAIQRGLAGVTLELDDWLDLQLARQVRAFLDELEDRRHPAPLAQRFDELRRIVEAYHGLRLTQPDKAAILREKLRRFSELRATHRVRDDHLSLRRRRWTLQLVARTLLHLTVGLPLTLWGWLNAAVPFAITRALSRRSARGRDQYDTAGILIGAPVFAGAWFVQTAAVAWLAWGRTDAPVRIALLYVLSVLIAAAVALGLGPARVRLRQDLAVTLRFLRRRRLRSYLLEKRRELMVEVAALVRRVRATTGEPTPTAPSALDRPA